MIGSLAWSSMSPGSGMMTPSLPTTVFRGQMPSRAWIRGELGVWDAWTREHRSVGSLDVRNETKPKTFSCG